MSRIRAGEVEPAERCRVSPRVPRQVARGGDIPATTAHRPGHRGVASQVRLEHAEHQLAVVRHGCPAPPRWPAAAVPDQLHGVVAAASAPIRSPRRSAAAPSRAPAHRRPHAGEQRDVPADDGHAVPLRQRREGEDLAVQAGDVAGLQQGDDLQPVAQQGHLVVLRLPGQRHHPACDVQPLGHVVRSGQRVRPGSPRRRPGRPGRRPTPRGRQPDGSARHDVPVRRRRPVPPTAGRGRTPAGRRLVGQRRAACSSRVIWLWSLSRTSKPPRPARTRGRGRASARRPRRPARRPPPREGLRRAGPVPALEPGVAEPSSRSVPTRPPSCSGDPGQVPGGLLEGHAASAASAAEW
jgi:hypothetical protein